MEWPEFIEVSLVYKVDDTQFQIELVNAVKFNQHYQIKAVPAFAENVALNDIVSVEYDKGRYFFEELIEASGHSVIHLIIFKEEFSANVIAVLALFGLGINYLNNNKYLVLDIPIEVDVKKLIKDLNVEKDSGNIDFRFPCLSDNHRAMIEKGESG